MKKRAALMLAAVLLTSSLAGCEASQGGENQDSGDATQGAEATGDYGEIADIYKDIVPLEEETTVRYIGSVGLQLTVPLYISYISGGMEKMGIDLEFIPASTGPLSIEALNAGEVDLVGTGIGGIAVGAANGSAKILSYINDDSVVQKFYVSKDSPLAEAEIDQETGIRGTAEDWKGKAVYMPAGTTLQYLMGVALDKMGLTLQDIEPVYMEANNVNTALFANQGDVWGIWNFLCYNSDLETEGYVPVVQGRDVGINLTTAFMTNEETWENEKMRQAINKIIELHFATLDWMQADEANMEKAAEILTDWCEAEGTAVDYEENLAYLKETYYYSLEENYEMFRNTVSNDHGDMYEALDALMGIMDFYVSQGNYTEDDITYMVEHQDDIFTVETLDAIQN